MLGLRAASQKKVADAARKRRMRITPSPRSFIILISLSEKQKILIHGDCALHHFSKPPAFSQTLKPGEI
jgi:hypothetical protein